MPGRAVFCCKSTRIYKGKIILIRHNYFPSNVNSGSCCTKTDTVTSHFQLKTGSILKKGQGLPVHLGPLANSKDYESWVGQKRLLLPGCWFRFRKIKTVVNTVFQIFDLFIGYLLANHSTPVFTDGETDLGKSFSSVPHSVFVHFAGDGSFKRKLKAKVKAKCHSGYDSAQPGPFLPLGG